MVATTGFLAPKRTNSVSLGAVLLLHGAAIAAVLLVKGPEWIRTVDKPLVVVDVNPPEIPPENPPPPTDQVVERPISQVDTPVTLVRAPVEPVITAPISTPRDTSPVIGPRVEPVREPVRVAEVIPPRPIPRTPVRVEAQFDPRFAGRQQPPYPESEIRAERVGVVSLRITIGTDGRVTAVQRLNATSDAFWRATERHALANWRFRPATEDGRPIQSSKTMTIRFRLDS